MTKTQRERYLAEKKREDNLKSLIKAAIYKYDIGTILDLMSEVCDKTERDEMQGKMIDLTTEGGAMYIKLDSLVNQEKLNDFLKTEIFPYYNEQQTQLFVY